MARNRVSSFFEKWSQPPRSPTSPPFDPQPAPGSPKGVLVKSEPVSRTLSDPLQPPPIQPSGSANEQFHELPVHVSSPDPSRARASTIGSRSSSRPASMVQTYQPPLMEVANDTPPELQPIFTFLNSHSNKLYQEGYFLKLHDLDTKGRPSGDRTWQECFAQLVGTVLSLWDAAELDSAGDDGEVVPTFINLADASIKMIESLPMNENDGQQLQNVLSISTAGNNRYLLHFNSLNSLTQWTAGIRLAMYEHATLQEAYTGSLIAGKGKSLNNIKQILERSKFKHEDWARVRFGAGTPWRRCWFVVTPPDEKEWEKAQKLAKKKSSYGKTPVLRGDVKFYETRKVTKRTRPIATITNAFSAYAIYPQSKPLIDQSTLVKLEGKITIHSLPESTTDGFVFVMPEVHPAVSGFEMMLRFLFPVWDTFALYGRPSRLIADVLDQRGLMFAMPRDRRYGYLEILDVAGLIHSEGSANWQERQWRRQMKELTSKRMLALGDDEGLRQRKSASRTSLPGSRSNTLRFNETSSGQQTPQDYSQPRRAESVLGNENGMHRRTASEAIGGLLPYQRDVPDRMGNFSPPYESSDATPPRPPPHSAGVATSRAELTGSMGRETPSPEQTVIPPEVAAMGTKSPPPGPVGAPKFAHTPSEKPKNLPNQAPELRRGISDLDSATLSQMAEATSAGSHNQRPSGQPVQGYSPYDSDYNGAAYGRQGGSSRSRGLSPDSRSTSDPRWGGSSQSRLATIPASPYIEQTSPILDRAGQVLASPQLTVSEHSPTRMAQNTAVAALAKSVPYSFSTNIEAQNGHNSFKGSDTQNVGLDNELYEIQPRPERTSTSGVHRKPVGSRIAGDSTTRHNHDALIHPENAHWNAQQDHYEDQALEYNAGNHFSSAQAALYHNRAAQSQYGQQYAHQGDSPAHGINEPAMHRQMPYRGPSEKPNGTSHGQGWM